MTDWILQTYWLASLRTFLAEGNDNDFTTPLADHLIVAPGHGNARMKHGKRYNGNKPYWMTDLILRIYWLAYWLTTFGWRQRRPLQNATGWPPYYGARAIQATTKHEKRKDGYRPWCKTDWILRIYWLASWLTFFGDGNENDFTTLLAGHLIVAPGHGNDWTRKSERWLQTLLDDWLDFADLLTGFLTDFFAEGNENDFTTPLAEHLIVAPGHGNDCTRKSERWLQTLLDDWLDFADLLTGFSTDFFAKGNENDFTTSLADHLIVAPVQTTATTKDGKRKDGYRPWCKTDWILRTYWLASWLTFFGDGNENDFTTPLAEHLILASGHGND